MTGVRPWEPRSQVGLKPGDLAVTGAGNVVYRLLGISKPQPKGADDVVWDVIVLFDAAGRRPLGPTQDTIKHLERFDAQRLGVLWLNFDNLNQQCRRIWSGRGTEKEGQKKQARSKHHRT